MTWREKCLCAVAAIVVAFLAGVAVRLHRDRGEAAAEREAVERKLARALGAKQVTDGELTAASFENRKLREDVARFEKAGIPVKQQVHYHSEGKAAVRVVCPVEDLGESLRGWRAVESVPPGEGVVPETLHGTATLSDVDVECGQVGNTFVCPDAFVTFAQAGQEDQVVHFPMGRESKWVIAPERIREATRTLMGPSAGVFAGDHVGYQIGAVLCPKSWGWEGKRTEGRACVQGEYQRAADDQNVTANAILLFGLGRDPAAVTPSILGPFVK